LSTLLDVHRGEGSLELQLSGEWRALKMPEIDAALAALDLTGISKVVIVADRVAALDLSGAWRLRELVRQLASQQIQATFRAAEPDQLRLVDQTLSDAAVPGRPASPETTAAVDTHLEVAIRRPLIDIGRSSIRFVRHLRHGVAFLGRVSVTFARALLQPHRLRPISIARHVYDTGITAIPIVALIAFLISVIIAYMSAQQLISFGATIFVVDLVTIGVLRELGVLLTAIIVAGRSGSAFAAEIGAMRLNEEGVKPERARSAPKPPPEVPSDLAARLSGNKAAKATFEAFPPSCRREYIDWIIEAKREETRAKRLAQAVEWMAEGKRRNWKYENC